MRGVLADTFWTNQQDLHGALPSSSLGALGLLRTLVCPTIPAGIPVGAKIIRERRDYNRPLADARRHWTESSGARRVRCGAILEALQVSCGHLARRGPRGPVPLEHRLGRILAAMRSAKPAFIAVALTLTLASYLLRAIRWHYLVLPIRKARFWSLLEGSWWGLPSRGSCRRDPARWCDRTSSRCGIAFG